MFTIIALLLVYPIWVLVHEGTHALTASYFGATIESFKPYPNRSLGRFTWGSVRWRGALSVHERGLVSFMPRVPAFVATLLLPLAAYYELPDAVLVLLAGGLVDQVVNFLGISSGSDLQKWCGSFSFNNPWYWRAIGQTTALMFGGVALSIRFLGGI